MPGKTKKEIQRAKERRSDIKTHFDPRLPRSAPGKRAMPGDFDTKGKRIRGR